MEISLAVSTLIFCSGGGFPSKKLNETRFVLLLISMLCLSTGLFSKTFCYFTLIQDPKTWTEAQSYCKNLGSKFVFNNAKLTWRDAQLHCRKNHVDLASISDGFENSALVQLLTHNYSQYEAWIGLSKNLWLWSDQSKVSWLSVKWAEGEPDNTDGNEKCGLVRETGLIGDEDCLHHLPFFCGEFNLR
uniref:C-type lectin domain-containing protein n=1 Tax=Sinocyclocheilus anshuiensis TaxID=1608454 RepID=A0A671NXZ5_9TELE